MREKEIKGWRREKKLKLILAQNPDWADLSLEWQENPGWNLVPEAQSRLKRKARRGGYPPFPRFPDAAGEGAPDPPPLRAPRRQGWGRWGRAVHFTYNSATPFTV